MTTFAMLAGTFPVAMGFGEVSKFRTSMGVAIIGGLILSTFLTLVVVPAIFEYIDTFREFVESKFRPKYKIKAQNNTGEKEKAEEIMPKEGMMLTGNPAYKGKGRPDKKNKLA
jgi:HAE1 family hydrophobic/amphiphilic exporter-1